VIRIDTVIWRNAAYAVERDVHIAAHDDVYAWLVAADVMPTADLMAESVYAAMNVALYRIRRGGNRP
jgi:hypothetical protein